jgi:hypothetical protein
VHTCTDDEIFSAAGDPTSPVVWSAAALACPGSPCRHISRSLPRWPEARRASVPVLRRLRRPPDGRSLSPRWPLPSHQPLLPLSALQRRYRSGPHLSQVAPTEDRCGRPGGSGRLSSLSPLSVPIGPGARLPIGPGARLPVGAAGRSPAGLSRPRCIPSRHRRARSAGRAPMLGQPGALRMDHYL